MTADKHFFTGAPILLDVLDCPSHRSGRIINIASVVGVTGNAGQANYAASKAGVIGLTRSAAKELSGRGVAVNAIAPGFIETDMTSEIPENERAKLVSAIPLSRMGATIRFDTRNLQKIAAITNGRFFRAKDTKGFEEVMDQGKVWVNSTNLLVYFVLRN